MVRVEAFEDGAARHMVAVSSAVSWEPVSDWASSRHRAPSKEYEGIGSEWKSIQSDLHSTSLVYSGRLGPSYPLIPPVSVERAGSIEYKKD
ncbi:hypothetical protein Baya_0851 [Bagarius yarrelli]|uniref:Uncharacterized protein n=1 Tax=Bagarius yarrelli TaxID=175774 RepID=A0A556TJF4_BAGYA|nr:hypothetical protein Baya_0851 [Bagarius yarrelli]